MTHAGLGWLGQCCKQLRTINLSNADLLTDLAAVTLLKGTPHLLSFVVSWCELIGDDTAEALAKYCPKIQVVSLMQTAITDKAMKSLGRCKYLRCVNISNTGITNEGLEELFACKKLEMIAFQDTKIDGASLQMLPPECPRFTIITRIQFFADNIQLLLKEDDSSE